MTINAYIETIIEKNPAQIITVYDDKHNITYHGKADFAPLNLWNEYKNSHIENRIDIDGNPVTDLIINGATDEPAKETTKRTSIMKRSYTYVNPEDVTACKELIRTMIKRDKRRCSFSLNENDAQEYAYKAAQFFDCMYVDFRMDLEEWALEEIRRQKRKSLS